MKRSVFFLFALSHIALGILLPSLQPAAAIGLLIQTSAALSLPSALWFGALLGVCFDSMNFSHPFGLYALTFCCISSMIVKLQSLVLREGLFSFALFTLCITAAEAVAFCLLSALLGKRIHYDLSGLITDFALFPLCDTVLIVSIYFLLPKSYEVLKKNRFFLEKISKKSKKGMAI